MSEKKVEHAKENIEEMKTALIKEYGDIHTTLNCIVREVDRQTIPSIDNNRALSNYMVKMVSMIRKCMKVKETKRLEAKWASVVLENPFLTRIINLLPPSMIKDLYTVLTSKSFTISKLEGDYALQCIMKFCEDQGDIATNTADRQDKQSNNRSKKPSKPAGAANAAMSQQEDDYVEDNDTPGQPQVHAVTLKRWHNTKLQFPCPIKQHDHELGVCQSFFSMSAPE